MSRIQISPVESATGATADVYAQIKKAVGRVPNAMASIGALNPAALKAILHADGVLAASSLSKQDQETIKLVVSAVAGCDYCVAAHSLIGSHAGLKADTLKKIRDGEATGEDKRDALIRFVRNLLETKGTISAASFNDIKSAGYGDAQLVDISLAMAVIVFTNTFNRINDTTVDFPAA